MHSRPHQAKPLFATPSYLIWQ